MTAPKIGEPVNIKHPTGSFSGKIVGFSSDAAGVYIEVFVYREEFDSPAATKWEYDDPTDRKSAIRAVSQ